MEKTWLGNTIRTFYPKVGDLVQSGYTNNIYLKTTCGHVCVHSCTDMEIGHVVTGMIVEPSIYHGTVTMEN